MTADLPRWCPYLSSKTIAPTLAWGNTVEPTQKGFALKALRAIPAQAFP